ncbi:hypothetical protein L2K70_04920 [Nocardioides KLBMP 9356]|uniref:XRE family transcriptional regulator n=1 Tax=Nocardioides potassii TaxID=2911371 RepID=A0ABS9HA18_9ACTN|nr:hypothetical protein [Nocardioides potassii]MCF6376938.1 hypothetical protein [Nocardioides potassii]
MKKYPHEHWVALGDWIAHARKQAGYTDTKRWAAAVGRSDRVVLGLERGEPQGAKTIEAVSEALGVSNWALFEILDKGSSSPDFVAKSPDEIQAIRARYESETGLEADAAGADLFAMFSDEELLDEIRRRLATRPMARSERRLREVQASPGSDSLDDDMDAAANESAGDPLQQEPGAEEDPST